MCLIVHKPKESILTRTDSERWLRANRDGWGVCYFDNDSVVMRKGLRAEEFLALLPTLANKECYIHFRLRTHGKVSLENAHPIEITQGIYFMHNGVFQIKCNRKNYSDSWHFAKRVLAPILERQKDPHDFLHSQHFKDRVKDITGEDSYNKYVVIDHLGGVIFNESRWTYDAVSGLTGSNSAVRPFYYSTKTEGRTTVSASCILDEAELSIEHLERFFAKKLFLENLGEASKIDCEELVRLYPKMSARYMWLASGERSLSKLLDDLGTETAKAMQKTVDMAIKVKEPSPTHLLPPPPEIAEKLLCSGCSRRVIPSAYDHDFKLCFFCLQDRTAFPPQDAIQADSEETESTNIIITTNAKNSEETQVAEAAGALN